LPTVYAVNRYPASVWYGGLRWSAWHTWLRTRGVSVSPLRLGATTADEQRQWMPFLSSSTTAIPDATAAAVLGIATSAARPATSVVAIAGELLHPAPSATMRAAAAALDASGVVLARLTLDQEDCVLSVDPTP